MRNSEANEEMFRRVTERMVTAAGLTEITPPTVFALEEHKFIRAEFERKGGALHYYQGIAQTGREIICLPSNGLQLLPTIFGSLVIACRGWKFRTKNKAQLPGQSLPLLKLLLE